MDRVRTTANQGFLGFADTAKSKRVPHHVNAYGVWLIALVLQGSLDHGAECLLVSILRNLGVSPNYLFTVDDPKQPIRLALIPGDFYPIRSHGNLRLESYMTQ
jgi:hypothetical protein